MAFSRRVLFPAVLSALLLAVFIAPAIALGEAAPGTLPSTANGTPGEGWVPQDSGVAVDLNSVSAADSMTAWVVGDGGTILKTEDGGKVWLAQDSGVSVDLNAVCAASPLVAWAGGDQALLKTEDGGIPGTPSPPFPPSMSAI